MLERPRVGATRGVITHVSESQKPSHRITPEKMATDASTTAIGSK